MLRTSAIVALFAFSFTSSACIIQDGRGGNGSPARANANNTAVTSGVSATSGQATNAGEQQTKATIGAFLDAWHNAAATANEDLYFGSMTEQGVFIGTDKTERWTRQEFIDAFKEKYFVGKEEAWTYIPQSRNIVLGAGGKLAWFDEKLTHKSGFHVRGSGVVQRQADGSWKIPHYVMSFPVPNEVADKVLKIVRDHETGKTDETGTGTGSTSASSSASSKAQTTSTSSMSTTSTGS